jgi:hypothetical protein
MSVMPDTQALQNVLSRQGFNDRCLGLIASHLRLASFARGELIYEHGERGDEMYLVIEGTVVVHANSRIFDADAKKIPRFTEKHAAALPIFGKYEECEGGDRRANRCERGCFWRGRPVPKGAGSSPSRECNGSDLGLGVRALCCSST